MIAGIPEMFYDFFDGGLCEDGIDFIIYDWSHEAGIDVELINVLGLYAIMFV